MEPYQTIGGFYGSSRIKGGKEDTRDSVLTLVNVIAESEELPYLVIVFPDQNDTEKNKNSH